MRWRSRVIRERLVRSVAWATARLLPWGVRKRSSSQTRPCSSRGLESLQVITRLAARSGSAVPRQAPVAVGVATPVLARTARAARVGRPRLSTRHVVTNARRATVSTPLLYPLPGRRDAPLFRGTSTPPPRLRRSGRVSTAAIETQPRARPSQAVATATNQPIRHNSKRTKEDT
jgi:hypothetical protein